MVRDGDSCLRQVMEVRGALGANLIDFASGYSFGSAGRMPNGDHQLTAAGIVGILHSMLGATALVDVGRPSSLDDVVITAANGYHLIHFVPGRPQSGIVLYLWLDRALGNLAMARRGLRLATAELVGG